MITPPSAENPTSGQAAPAEPGLDVTAQAFWEKNRTLILVVLGAALLAIIGREGWQYLAHQRDLGVQADYAKVSDRPEQLAAFAAAHGDHPLGGVALLRLADARYAAGDFRQAGENYKKALATLKQPALLGRARVGAAVSQVSGGDTAGGETALKSISTDTTLPKNIRAEAYYHLATLAKDAGNTAEVTRLVAEIGKVDPVSVWAQRATSLVAVSQ